MKRTISSKALRFIVALKIGRQKVPPLFQTHLINFILSLVVPNKTKIPMKASNDSFSNFHLGWSRCAVFFLEQSIIIFKILSSNSRWKALSGVVIFQLKLMSLCATRKVFRCKVLSEVEGQVFLHFVPSLDVMYSSSSPYSSEPSPKLEKDESDSSDNNLPFSFLNLYHKWSLLRCHLPILHLKFFVSDLH